MNKKYLAISSFGHGPDNLLVVETDEGPEKAREIAAEREKLHPDDHAHFRIVPFDQLIDGWAWYPPVP